MGHSVEIIRGTIQAFHVVRERPEILARNSRSRDKRSSPGRRRMKEGASRVKGREGGRSFVRTSVRACVRASLRSKRTREEMHAG